MKDIQGKVALVTGGSRGIGAAVAIALAEAGVDVAVNYRNGAQGANEVCARIEKTGRRGCAVRTDVSQSSEVASMVAEVNRKLGQINILVNNAGIARQQKIEDITEADCDEII